jgi:hypothetical protein
MQLSEFLAVLKSLPVDSPLTTHVASLQKWRVSGSGPKFVKNPRSVRYKAGDVRDWIAIAIAHANDFIR